MKPKLVPLKVVWSMSVDDTELELLTDERGFPQSIVFVGCFRNHPYDPEAVFINEEDGTFRLAKEGEQARFHKVKLTFIEGMGSGWHDHYTDRENINYAVYDLSEFPGCINPMEPLEEQIYRNEIYEKESGFCATPRAFEIVGSKSLTELAGDRTDLHHFLFLGSERNLSVIAKGMEWQLGQAMP